MEFSLWIFNLSLEKKLTKSTGQNGRRKPQNKSNIFKHFRNIFNPLRANPTKWSDTIKRRVKGLKIHWSRKVKVYERLTGPWEA